MNRKRQNNQQELALEPKDRGEAPARGDEETEPFMAKSATENPAFSRLNSIEPPCTDPYARWCGRGGAERLPPIPIVGAKRPFGKDWRGRPCRFCQDVSSARRLAEQLASISLPRCTTK